MYLPFVVIKSYLILSYLFYPTGTIPTNCNIFIFLPSKLKSPDYLVLSRIFAGQFSISLLKLLPYCSELPN